MHHPLTVDVEDALSEESASQLHLGKSFTCLALGITIRFEVSLAVQ